MVHGFAVAVGAEKVYLIENSVDFLRIGDFNLSPQLREEWNVLSARMDAGEITPGGARNRMRRHLNSPLSVRPSQVLPKTKKHEGKAASKRSQINAVQGAVGTLEGTIFGLNQIDDLPEILAGFEPEEGKTMIKRVEEFRRQTGHLLTTLRKAAT